MTIRNVLVVDDSKTELLFLSDLLKKSGFSVTTAENAEEALSRLEQAKPDLILMDVVMPGTNGFQLTRKNHARPAFFRCSRHHVHEQEYGNRPRLGHAAGRT